MSEIRRLPRRLRAFPSAGLDECNKFRGGSGKGQACPGDWSARRAPADPGACACACACGTPTNVLMY
jgi:hypothetical protein